MADWLQVLLGFAPVYFPILLTLAGMAFKAFEANLPANKLAVIHSVAGTVVPAIEQIAEQNSSAEKKQKAVEAAVNTLQTLGVKNVNSSALSAALEAVVYGLNLAKSAPQAEPVEASGSNPQA